MSLLILHRRRPRWLFGLLILVLLGPGLVPVQGHTRLVASLDGGINTICTWQPQTAFDIPEPWKSPAYLYALLIGGAAFDSSVPPAPQTTPASDHPILLSSGEQLAAVPGRYLIRAPPSSTS